MKLKSVPVYQLSGRALDCAVALSQGSRWVTNDTFKLTKGFYFLAQPKFLNLMKERNDYDWRECLGSELLFSPKALNGIPKYHKGKGDLILFIDKYLVQVMPTATGQFRAMTDCKLGTEHYCEFSASDAITAICQAVVGSLMGQAVYIPEELVK